MPSIEEGANHTGIAGLAIEEIVQCTRSGPAGINKISLIRHYIHALTHSIQHDLPKAAPFSVLLEFNPWRLRAIASART